MLCNCTVTLFAMQYGAEADAAEVLATKPTTRPADTVVPESTPAVDVVYSSTFGWVPAATFTRTEPLRANQP